MENVYLNKFSAKGYRNFRKRIHNYMKHEGHLDNNDVVVGKTPIFILTYFYPFINQISEENL